MLPPRVPKGAWADLAFQTAAARCASAAPPAPGLRPATRSWQALCALLSQCVAAQLARRPPCGPQPGRDAADAATAWALRPEPCEAQAPAGSWRRLRWRCAARCPAGTCLTNAAYETRALRPSADGCPGAHTHCDTASALSRACQCVHLDPSQTTPLARSLVRLFPPCALRLVELGVSRPHNRNRARRAAVAESDWAACPSAPGLVRAALLSLEPEACRTCECFCGARRA